MVAKAMANTAITPEEYQAFSTYLESVCGILLGGNKQYLVNSRLERILAERGFQSIGELVDRLGDRCDLDLHRQVVDAMTTNETLWFRDSHPFEALKTTILPQLSRERQAPLRIWSAACSTGQEPYSISMAIQEYLFTRPSDHCADTQIIATDISTAALKHAKAGQYDNLSLSRGLSPERKRLFFRPNGTLWELKENIRNRVRFDELNLVSDIGKLGRVDIIFCRNVLIYFSTSLKKDILARYVKVLNPGGYLLVGATESMATYSDAFETVRYDGGLVYKLKS